MNSDKEKLTLNRALYRHLMKHFLSSLCRQVLHGCCLNGKHNDRSRQKALTCIKKEMASKMTQFYEHLLPEAQAVLDVTTTLLGCLLGMQH